MSSVIDQYFAGTEAAKSAPEPYSPVPGLLAPSFRRGLVLAVGRPRSWLERVLRASDYGPERVRRPPRRSLPTAAALRSRGFLGKRRGSSGSARLVPRPGFRFHLTQPAHLISASPPRGSHPPPAQPSRAEAEPRAFEVRRISIPEEPAGPKTAAPAGEGTAGPWRGGGCPPRRGR